MAGEQAGGNNPRHEAENPQEFDWNKFGEIPVKYVAQAIAELRQADPAIGAIDWADLYGERVSSDVAAKIQAKAEEIRANENSPVQGQESPAQEQAPADASEGSSGGSGEQAAQREGGAERRRNVPLWRRIGVRVLAVAAAVGIAIGGIGAAFGIGPAGRLKKLRASANGTRTEMGVGDAADGMAMGIDEALDEYNKEIRSDALSDANLDAIIAEANAQAAEEAAEQNESFNVVADNFKGLFADAETGTKPNPEKSNPVNFVAPIEYKESGDYRGDIDKNVRNMSPVLAAYYEKLDDKDKLPELVGKSCADLQTMMAEDPSVHQKIYEHFMSEMESTENGTVDGRCYNEYMVTSASDGETINSKNTRVVFCETIENNTRVIVVHFKNGSVLKIKLNCGQAVIEIEETNEGILISYYETKEELPEDEQPSNSVKKRFIPKDVFEGTDTIEWPDTGPGPVTEDPDKDEEEKELGEKKDLNFEETFEGTDTTGWQDETGPGSADDVTGEPDAMEGIDGEGRAKDDGGQSTEATEDPNLEGDNSESSSDDGGGSSESSNHDNDDGGHDSGSSESHSSESSSHSSGSSHSSSESHKPASQERAKDESRSSEGQKRAEQEKSNSNQRHEDSKKSEQAAQSVKKQSDNAIKEHTDSSGKTDVNALLDMD